MPVSPEFVEACRVRVKRGVVALDAADPNWRTRINIETFDMRSSCKCVIGQVCGISFPRFSGLSSSGRIDRPRVLEAVTGNASFDEGDCYPTDLGFDVDDFVTEQYGVSYKEHFDTLKNLWLEEIHGDS